MIPRTLLLLATVTLGVAGPSPVRAQDDEFPPGTRVEVDGHWRGDHVEVLKIVQEEPDEYEEVKGFPTSIDVEARTIIIPPFTIVIDDETDIEDDDEEEESYDLEELRLEYRLKVDCEVIGPLTLRAVEIAVETESDEREIELEGVIQSSRLEPDGTRVVVLLGVECRIGAESEVVRPVIGDVIDVGFAEAFGPRSRRRLDRDDRRPEEQIILFDRVIIGGEVQLDWELEDNYNLDDGDNEDIFALDTSAILEANLIIDDASFAFAKMRTAKAYVIFDEDDPNKDFHEDTKLEELYGYHQGIFDLPLAIQVGRQDFDEAREWLYDENLDAVRLYWAPASFEIEYSWATFLHDAPKLVPNDVPHRLDETVYQTLVARYRHAPDSFVGAYMIDIVDSSDRDVSPFFLGVRAQGRIDRSLMYWFDYAYVDGVDGSQEIEAHGGDAGIGYQFRDVPLRPYVYAGYAFGTGDGKPGGRTDRNFRQTGLQDNNDNFFGVASFSYYGEQLRPELSNLHITTLGVGIEPLEWLSVDLLLHTYRQDEGADFLRDADVKPSPSGLDRDIGREIDLVVGLDDIWRNYDLELDIGYFVPGSAFGNEDDPALWIALQIERNF